MIEEGIVSLTIGVIIVTVILFGLGYFMCYLVHIIIPNKKFKQKRETAALPRYKTLKKDYGAQLKHTVPELRANNADMGIKRHGKIPEKKG